MTIQSRILKSHPSTILLASFLLVIAAGVLLLELPVSTVSGHIAWVDALFTATSAVCVTGLTVLDPGSAFTLFGQCVILALIQVGGLGLMTISVALFRWIGRSVSFRYRMVLQDVFAHTPRADIFGLLKSVLFFTLTVEFIGAALLTIHWRREFPLDQAAYRAIFHSVSAFCNAGFSLFPDSFMRYSGSTLLNVTICGLIVIGGIGFPVLYDLQNWLSGRKRRRIRLSIHTKTVLLTTSILILAGAFMFAFLEQQSLSTAPSLSHRILAPLFQSITCRTAGFNTVDIGSLKEATLALMICLMFFGASPGSCGGGVKTTTLALLVLSIAGWLRRASRVHVFKKSIPRATLDRSVTLTLLAIGMISLIVFLILAGNAVSGHVVAGPRGSFLGYLFETVSAFGTVGLSMGITPDLNVWGKLMLALMMIIGRVGVLTFAYIFAGAAAGNGIEYAEENLMVG